MKNINCSVLVPVYNPNLKVFEVMLRSLAKQTYQSFEVILVDDSDQIDITDLVKKFPQLNLRHVKNIEKLGFDKMQLKAPIDEAADVVMTDKGHLDPNPIPISKDDVIKCLNAINDGNL